jgi:2,5-furandicarboxylate decarboxylase 1
VIEGAQGSPLDPSTTIGQPDDAPPHLQGVSAKMGLDATRPVVYQAHVFTRVRIPGEELVDLDTLVATDNAAFDAWLGGARHD